MNVIETFKKTLSTCKLMDAFNGTHIDYTEDKSDDCGLFSNGSRKVSEDVIGNQRYTHSFIVYAMRDSFEDFSRLENSSWLLDLTYWLNEQKDIPITATVGEEERNGVITSISAGNAMSFDVPTQDITDGIRYQLQITVAYKIYGGFNQ